MKNMLLSAIAAVTLTCATNDDRFEMIIKEEGVVAVICQDGTSEFDWKALKVLAKKQFPKNSLTEEVFYHMFAKVMVAAHDNKQP